MNDDQVHLSFLPTVDVFDASIRVGQPRDALSSCATAELLLAEMDERGVSRALVYHAHAETLSPRDGQQMLERFIAGRDRLVPQACIMPTDEGLELLGEVESRHQLSSVRLACEAPSQLPFTADIYGPVCAWLERRSIAMFVHAETIDLTLLPAVARSFPQLRMVLVGAHYMHYLCIKPLMRAIPMLHLELSRYEAFDQVNQLAGEFGAERLIYGSGYPLYAMGPMLFYLHRCGMSRRDLELVCGGNLRRLLARGANP